MIFGDHRRDSAFPASTICSMGLRAHEVRPYRYARYGVASYRCSVRVRFSPPWNPAFRGTTLLWSAQLSCVQMSGFRVRDGLLAHCEKTNPRSGPFSFFFVAVFLRPWLFPLRVVPPFPWPDPRRHINYPANGRSFGIIRNLIRGYTPRRARVCISRTYICKYRYTIRDVKNILNVNLMKIKHT